MKLLKRIFVGAGLLFAAVFITAALVVMVVVVSVVSWAFKIIGL